MGASLQGPSFDIDHYLNRIIPRNHIHLLPKPISWFLGYRESRPAPIGNVFVWWWAFIGAFAGILVVEAVFQTKYFQAEGTPIVIASLVSLPFINHYNESLTLTGITRVQQQFSSTTPSTHLFPNPAMPSWVKRSPP
jgi:hypothetical protein